MRTLQIKTSGLFHVFGGLNDLRQKLARLPHKGQSLDVLIGSRRLTHEHDLRTGTATPKHEALSGFTQGAVLTLANILIEGHKFHGLDRVREGRQPLGFVLAGTG